MKQYPSIPGPSKAPREPCYAFIKYDGSNLRFQWSRKQGWHLFGTRHELFNETSKWFGPALPVFFKKYANPIEEVIRKDKKFKGIDKVIVFCEYFGLQSFAGWHAIDDPNDPKDLVLFDVNLNKKGFLSPKEFIDSFGHLPVAELVYHGNLNEPFINDVRTGKLRYESKFEIKTKIPEGVVCKGGSGHKLWMTKVKTIEYYDTIRAVHPANWEDYWE